MKLFRRTPKFEVGDLVRVDTDKSIASELVYEWQKDQSTLVVLEVGETYDLKPGIKVACLKNPRDYTYYFYETNAFTKVPDQTRKRKFKLRR